MTETGAESAPAVVADAEVSLEEVVRTLDLLHVRTLKYSGELLAPRPRKPATMEFSIVPAFRMRGRELDCKFEVAAPIKDGDGKALAALEVAIVATFSVPAETSLNKELIDQFIGKVALMVAMPFLREAVQSLTVRLGIPPLTVGLLKAGGLTPTSAAVDGFSYRPGRP